MRLTSSPCFAVRHLLAGGQTHHWTCEFQFIQLDAQRGMSCGGRPCRKAACRKAACRKAVSAPRPRCAGGSGGCLGAPVRRLERECRGFEPSIDRSLSGSDLAAKAAVGPAGHSSSGSHAQRASLPPIDPKLVAMRAIQLVAPLGRFIPEVEEPSGGKRVQFK